MQNSHRKIAFCANSVIHLQREIKALNIWLVFLRLIASKNKKKCIFYKPVESTLTG